MRKQRRSSANKLIGLFFRSSRAAYSAVSGEIPPKFHLIKALMVVLVTCKNEEDPIKKEEDLRFPIVSIWEMMTPGAWLI